MDIAIRERNKVRIDQIGIGKNFKLVDNNDCYIRVDLSKEVAFKDVLRDDVVYAVHLETGELVIFEKAMVVQWIYFQVVEK